MGDLNARIVDNVLNEITHRFKEKDTDDHGDILKYSSALNNLPINNTFFDHYIGYK